MTELQEGSFARRDRFVAAVANFVLRFGSQHYRDMIGGSIWYGLRAAGRDAATCAECEGTGMEHSGGYAVNGERLYAGDTICDGCKGSGLAQ